MSDLCSIHITKECHEILKNLSEKYKLDMRKLANFCILQSAKEIQKDHTRIFEIFNEEKIETAKPTIKEIIEVLFDRVSLQEGRDFVWHSEIHKVINPKSAANQFEIEKLGYLKYFPEGKLVLAWKKN